MTTVMPDREGLARIAYEGQIASLPTKSVHDGWEKLGIEGKRAWFVIADAILAARGVQIAELSQLELGVFIAQKSRLEHSASWSLAAAICRIFEGRVIGPFGTCGAADVGAEVVKAMKEKEAAKWPNEGY